MNVAISARPTRTLWAVLAANVLCAACDGFVELRGTVANEAGDPICGADVYFRDRIYDRDFARYLETRDMSFLEDVSSVHSEDDGSFVAGETLAGPGRHDLWLVVVSDGCETHVERLWSHRGVVEELSASVVLRAPVMEGHAGSSCGLSGPGGNAGATGSGGSSGLGAAGLAGAAP